MVIGVFLRQKASLGPEKSLESLKRLLNPPLMQQLKDLSIKSFKRKQIRLNSSHSPLQPHQKTSPRATAINPAKSSFQKTDYIQN